MVYEPGRFEGVDADDEDDDGGRRQRRGDRHAGAAARCRSRSRNGRCWTARSTRRACISAPTRTTTRCKVTLVPARTRCLCCGGTAGSRNVITPVSLGTSAAVKVVGEGLVEALAEANRDRPGHDGKERLLVFSDSRQDAAHQARFIIFASRYDRMRSRLVKILQTERVLTLQRAVEMLSEAAVSQPRQSARARMKHGSFPTRHGTGFGPGKKRRCWTRSPSTRATGARWSIWDWPTSITTGSTSTCEPAAASWPGDWASASTSWSTFAGPCWTKSARGAACRGRCSGTTRPTSSARRASSRPSGNAA